MVPNIVKKHSAFIIKGQEVHKEHSSRTLDTIHPKIQRHIQKDQKPQDMSSLLPLHRMSQQTGLEAKGIRKIFSASSGGWGHKREGPWQDFYS
jgi:hypothetical protein